jgi:hypothetical protein
MIPPIPDASVALANGLAGNWRYHPLDHERVAFEEGLDAYLFKNTLLGVDAFELGPDYRALKGFIMWKVAYHPEKFASLLDMDPVRAFGTPRHRRIGNYVWALYTAKDMPPSQVAVRKGIDLSSECDRLPDHLLTYVGVYPDELSGGEYALYMKVFRQLRNDSLAREEKSGESTGPHLISLFHAEQAAYENALMGGMLDKAYRHAIGSWMVLKHMVIRMDHDDPDDSLTLDNLAQHESTMFTDNCICYSHMPTLELCDRAVLERFGPQGRLTAASILIPCVKKMRSDPAFLKKSRLNLLLKHERYEDAQTLMSQ